MTYLATSIDHAGWQRDCTTRWISMSGPCYVDMTVKIMSVNKSGVFVTHNRKEIYVADRKLSYASWLICREAVSGDKVLLKVRLV